MFNSSLFYAFLGYGDPGFKKNGRPMYNHPGPVFFFFFFFVEYLFLYFPR